MKILQVVPHFSPCVGGLEKAVYDLTLQLKKRGHEVEVVTLNKCAKSGDELRAKEIIDGITVHRIPFTSFTYYAWAPKVMEFVKGFDLLHIHGIGFFSDYLVWKKKEHKKPIVISTHGGIFHTEKIMWLKKLYFNYWCKGHLRDITIIAVSENDKKLFSKISNKVELIENAIDYGKFSSVPRNVEQDTYLFVGRISRNKRVEKLIDVFTLVVRENPVTKLFIVGGDWEGLVKGLKEKISGNGMDENIFMMGKLSDTELDELRSRCEFFVSASRYEGFGISLVEAMASGIVPVVNDIGAFRNIVEDGRNGYIVDYTFEKNVAKKLLSLSYEGGANYAELSAEARNSAKKYAWERAIKSFEGVYEKLLKGAN
ncbi:MAG: glycosyltransferase family 4 protein [Candidatus Diapherotrites archaeon]